MNTHQIDPQSLEDNSIHLINDNPSIDQGIRIKQISNGESLVPVKDQEVLPLNEEDNKINDVNCLPLIVSTEHINSGVSKPLEYYDETELPLINEPKTEQSHYDIIDQEIQEKYERKQIPISITVPGDVNNEETEREITTREHKKKKSSRLPTQVPNDLKENKDNHDKKDEYIQGLLEDIKQKDTTISTLSTTNVTLRQYLGRISKEMDNAIQKTGMKTLSSAYRKVTKPETTIEMELQKKDKELKNAIALIDIYSKENRNLKKNLDTYGEYQYKVDISNKLKEKENIVDQLNKENKLFKKQLEEHNKCTVIQQDLENIIISLKKDLHTEKKKYFDLNAKYRNLESKVSAYTTTGIKDKINSSPRIIHPIQYKQKIEIKPLIKIPSVKEVFNSNKFLSLFDEKDKEIITQILKDDIEKQKVFFKKIDQIESYRTSTELILKNQIKKQQDIIEEKDNHINALNEKCKESETRHKIALFQINDLKKNAKVYQKKIVDYQKKVESINVKKSINQTHNYSNEITDLRNDLIEAQSVPLDDIVEKEINKIKADTMKQNEVNNMEQVD